MQTAIVSIFPEMIRAALAVGVSGRALRDGRLDCCLFDPRDYAEDARRAVDDRPFGGGPGMVMTVAPLQHAVAAAKERLPAAAPVIFLTPQGSRFHQGMAKELAALPAFMLVAARYEGVDERFVRNHVDREISLGDYVLSGGELAALAVLDAVARLLPGVLGNPQSVVDESHMDGLLDCPQYTRPAVAGGQAVPSVLLSGDHGAIAAWRRRESLRRTWQRRPGLLLDRNLNAADRELLAASIDHDPPNQLRTGGPNAPQPSYRGTGEPTA